MTGLDSHPLATRLLEAVPRYLGRPWKADCHPPWSFHCWSLVRWFQEKELERECPDYEVLSPSDPAMVSQAVHRVLCSRRWSQLPQGVPGCVVAMNNSREWHVGVFLPGERVLHCCISHGTVCQELRLLRRMGYHSIQYYTLPTWPASL